MDNKKKLLLLILSSVLLFSFDRISKLHKLYTNNYSINKGTAFGFFSNFEYTPLVLILIALVVSFFCLFFYFRKKGFSYLHIALLLLFSGSVSNLVDRIIYRYVIDFITLNFLPIPAFNLADVFNFFGLLLLLVFILKNENRERSNGGRTGSSM